MASQQIIPGLEGDRHDYCKTRMASILSHLDDPAANITESARGGLIREYRDLSIERRRYEWTNRRILRTLLDEPKFGVIRDHVDTILCDAHIDALRRASMRSASLAIAHNYTRNWMRQLDDLSKVRGSVGEALDEQIDQQDQLAHTMITALEQIKGRVL